MPITPGKFTLTLHRTGDIEQPGTVDYALSGDAVLGTHYTDLGGTANPSGASGTVSFATGESDKTITGDVRRRNDYPKTVTCTITNPQTEDGSSRLDVTVVNRSISNLDSLDPIVPPIDPTDHEVKSATERKFGGDGTYNSGGSTPLEIVGDDIFMAWNDGTTLKVSKFQIGSGTPETVVLMTGVPTDLDHNMPSLAIDTDGYIHIAGECHNDPWRYYISNQPMDISSGFRLLTTSDSEYPPGDSITYPEFYKDNAGNLYLTYRQWVTKTNAGGPSGLQYRCGGGVARYSAATKTYTALGGTDAPLYPTEPDTVKTLFWSPSGSMGPGPEGWYSQPRPFVYFDANNRMHVAAVMSRSYVTRTYNGHQHLLYAYSDDYGATFRKVDGTPVTSLPLTAETASVVVDVGAAANLFTDIKMGVFANGRPVIFYKTGNASPGTVHVKRWNGTDAWEDVPSVPNAPYFIMTRKNGEGLWFNPYNTIYRTIDNGDTFQSFGVGGSISGRQVKPDWEHYYATGNIVYQMINNTDGGVDCRRLEIGPV